MDDQHDGQKRTRSLAWHCKSVEDVLATLDAAGNPVTSIRAGQEFFVQLVVEDLRKDGIEFDPISGERITPRGIFAAYTDVLYDKNLQTLAVDDNLIDQGLLDSLAILRVVSFCEEQFGVTIPDTEVLPDNMESVGAIAKLVERVRK